MVEKLVTALLSTGEPLLFEVDEVDDFGITAVSISVDPETGIVDLDRALGGVRKAASEVLNAIRSIPVPPDTCEVTFGVKLSGTLGAIIAKASTEANFTIKMVWSAKKQ